MSDSYSESRGCTWNGSADRDSVPRVNQEICLRIHARLCLPKVARVDFYADAVAVASECRNQSRRRPDEWIKYCVAYK